MAQADQKGRCIVNCHCCQGEVKKFGSFQNKNLTVQRYRCTRCAKTFGESQPLDGVRVDFEQAGIAPLINTRVRFPCPRSSFWLFSTFMVLETGRRQTSPLGRALGMESIENQGSNFRSG